MMSARRAISAGKSRSSMPRKLVSGISDAPVRFAAPLVDLGLDRPHLLVGDDEEIAGAAGRVEDPDPRHALAQVEQLAGIVARLLKLRAQVVEEQRIEHLQDVRHAGVVHAERAALLVLGDGLDHRAEDVRVDLRPVETADVQQIGARDPAEARHVQCCRRTARRSRRETHRPSGEAWQLARSSIFVFMARNSSPITSWVLDESLALICSTVAVNRPLAVEDVGVLGEEAEDQPRHEMVHVVAALGRAPFGVVLQQLDIEPVQAAGRPDVEGVFADLLDGGDAGQRQEEAEMVGKVRIGAGDRLAARQVLGLERLAVRRQDELRLGLARSPGWPSARQASS